MDNFQCQQCNHTFFVAKYSFVIRDLKPNYYVKSDIIRCPKCQSSKILTLNNEICSNLAEYSSASMERKQEILRCRARQATRRMEEQHRVIDRKFDGHVNSSHY